MWLGELWGFLQLCLCFEMVALRELMRWLLLSKSVFLSSLFPHFLQLLLFFLLVVEMNSTSCFLQLSASSQPSTASARFVVLFFFVFLYGSGFCTSK